LALAAFGRRKRRSVEEERTRVTDLDVAKVRFENNIEIFLKKLNSMHLK
jgi:hypothetical protein